MLNHVAILKPPLPQLNVELVSWYITKSCFGVVHNIELGGGDKVCFVNVQQLCNIGWNGLKGFVGQDCSWTSLTTKSLKTTIS
jgi:hypothetical protein